MARHRIYAQIFHDGNLIEEWQAMVNDTFKDSLLGVYHGEQFGEAFFASLLQFAENDQQHFILGALLQLETEGKAKVRPLLARLGASLANDPKSIERGVRMARDMNEMGWQDKFKAMAVGIKENGLPQYEALMGMVSADEDAEAYEIARFIGEHERVILQVCENIIAETPNPTLPLADFLDFPLSSPSAD